MTEIRPFDRILAIVKERGLSERKACESAGLNASALASARRNDGKLDLDTISAFAAAFGVPRWQLIVGEEEAQAPQTVPAAVAAHSRLFPSPLNPRKRFDPEAIQDLSQSVEKEGVLMQLLVRRANQPGNAPIPDAQATDFEIIAGERRWRAAGLVIERGAFATDQAMPIRIIDPCSDRKMLELALTENVARKDMTPWEEAESFAKLAEQGATPAEIGDVVGLTARTVQKRLRLVRDLTPKVREALGAGELSVEFANVLAAYCPKSKQDGTLNEIKSGRFETTSSLKRTCLSLTYPVSRAIFDLSKYKGEILQDDDSSERYFVDVGQFERLQLAAAEAKCKEMADQYAWAKVFDERANGGGFRSWEYDTRPGHKKAGAAIVVGYHREVKIHVDQVAQKDAAGETKKRSSGGTSTPAEPVTKAHCIHAHQRKTAAIQNAVAAEPVMAMRLVCAALLGATGACRIDSPEIREYKHSADVQEKVESFLPHFGNLKGKVKFSIGSRGASLYQFGCEDHQGIWSALAAMNDEAVAALFASLVALRTGTFSDWNPSIGDGEMSVRVAHSLGLVGTEERHGLAVQLQDLEGVRKEALVTFTRSTLREGGVSDLKASALKSHIAGKAGPNTVFPTLRFAPAGVIEKLLAGAPLPSEINRALGTSAIASPPPAPTSVLTDAQLDACLAVNAAAPAPIAAKEVELTSGCSRDDLVKLVGEVLCCDNNNFLTAGGKFPSQAILASHAARKAAALPLTQGKGLGNLINKLAERVEHEEPSWDPYEKIEEVRAGLRLEDGVILNVKSDEDVRRGLTHGINAWRMERLDTEIPSTESFCTDEIPVDAQELIDQLFEIYAPDDEYDAIDTLDDAVVFVCTKLEIVPTFVSRNAAE